MNAISDQQQMQKFICRRISPDGETIVIASGDDGEILADLTPLGNDEDGWELEWNSNEPDAVDLWDVYDHFRRREMTWRDWRRELKGKMAVAKVPLLEKAIERLRGEVEQGSVTPLSVVVEQIHAKLDLLTANAVAEYVSVKNAAVITGLSQSHIRRAIYSGELPASNQGSEARPNWRIARTDLAAWMEKKKGGASKLPPKPELKGLVERHLPGL